MKKLKIIAIALSIAVASIGCAGRHPSDIAAAAIVPATQSYLITEKALLQLHDACIAVGDNCPELLKPIVENWNKIDDYNDLVSEQFRITHEAWILLSQANTPENEKQFVEQLRLLSAMVAKLSEYIPEKESN